MAVNDTYRLTLRALHGTQEIANTFHFREIISPPSGTPEQDLANEWQSACQATWLLACPQYYSLQVRHVQKVCGNVPLPDPVEDVDSLPAAGAYTITNPLPSFIALPVALRTGLAGRSRRGRTFMPAVGEADSNGEGPEAGYVTKVNNYFTALFAQFVGLSAASGYFRLVIHSHKLASVPGTQCQNSSSLVTSYSISTRWGTMRSRKVK